MENVTKYEIAELENQLRAAETEFNNVYPEPLTETNSDPASLDTFRRALGALNKLRGRIKVAKFGPRIEELERKAAEREAQE